MGSELITSLSTITLCLLFSAFFSSSETAITAVSRARIYHRILEGDRKAQLVGALRKQKERLIGSIMIGNNVVNILATAIATDLAISRWGQEGIVYTTIIMTVIVVIFSEVLPKTYAIYNSEEAALALAPALNFALKALYPLSAGLHVLVRYFFLLLGIDIMHPREGSSASDVIRGTIELHHHEGDVVKQDRDMLGSILDMQDVEVGDIMVHRLSMETIDASLSSAEIVAAAVSGQHSRIPLWEGEPENIIGVLYVKTLMRYLRSHGQVPTKDELRAMLVAPWFVPVTTTLKKQLHAFRAARKHLALVVDEYGALQGLVTLEDILEEITGRIGDEHGRQHSGEITHAGDGIYIIGGATTLRDVNRELGWGLPDEEASTIAGLLIHEARLIPEEGEQFEFYGFRFTVLSRQGNQITRLKVEKLIEPKQ